MTKPKSKNELKAYRGKQSYLTEEQALVQKITTRIKNDRCDNTKRW